MGACDTASSSVPGGGTAALLYLCLRFPSICGSELGGACPLSLLKLRWLVLMLWDTQSLATTCWEECPVFLGCRHFTPPCPKSLQHPGEFPGGTDRVCVNNGCLLITDFSLLLELGKWPQPLNL